MSAITDSHTTAQQSKNPFLQTALAYALTYAFATHHAVLEPAMITILADTDYYSCRGPSREDSTLTTARFLRFNKSIGETHKTGLGSSAALVTAFTAAVIAHFIPSTIFDSNSQDGRLRLHNLAQAAHCAAQGKVGSGFDVAAAVFGSCVYKRFSPQILDKLGDIGVEGFSSRLRSIIEDTDSTGKWDMEIEKDAANIPRGLRIVMCDVNCGSETVGMVKEVLAWKRQYPEEASLLWATLHTANENLAMQLRHLALQTSPSPKDSEDLRSTILTIRSLTREMSERTGVPIEPHVQTALIDACCTVPGVIGGVVPGAGGYDAIALLVENRREVVDDLREFLDSYQTGSIEHGGVGISSLCLLGVKQEYEGLKAEELSIYQGWLR